MPNTRFCNTTQKEHIDNMIKEAARQRDELVRESKFERMETEAELRRKWLIHGTITKEEYDKGIKEARENSRENIKIANEQYQGVVDSLKQKFGVDLVSESEKANQRSLGRQYGESLLQY